MRITAACILAAVVALGPSMAMGQPAPKASGQTMNVRGIIASMQAVNCTSSASSDCKTVLVITAGPTKPMTKPGHSVAVVAPVTVVVMPHTPFTWTRFNKTVAPGQLQPGDAVDIDYQLVGVQNVATRVDVSLQ